jgi:hypothetical protein
VFVCLFYILFPWTKRVLPIPNNENHYYVTRITKKLGSDMSEQNRNSGNEKENVRSLEDEDSVCRSTKKKKDSHPTTGNEDGAGLGSYFPEGFKAGMSYRDSLLGELPGAYEQAFFGSAMEDDLVSSDEEDDPPEDGEVVISIPRETKLRIRAPWSTSFIVKVFGRSVGYLFLVNRLKSLWKPIGGFSCVDLGLGFFLVKLDLTDDFDRILKGGPWFIGEHFLSLRPWVPDFRPSEASVNTVAVWVRLLELPVEYYDKESLLLIGHALGPVLRVDFNTASGTRGRFARLCIQLDLDKPLIKTIRVGKVRQAVIYEGIGLLCFHCGRIGHKIDKCPERGGTTPLAPTAPAQSDAPPPTNSPERDAESTFGPWMLVSRRKRQNKPKPDNFARSGEENSVVTLAPGRVAQTNKDGNASTSSPEKTKQAPQFRWKSSANPNPKGKAVVEPLRSPPTGPDVNGPKDQKQQSPIPSPSSIQSQPISAQSNLTPKPNISSILAPPSSNPSSSFNLRPQTPLHRAPHNPNGASNSTVISRPFCLDNSSERQSRALGRGDYRDDSSGPATHLGLVPGRDGTSVAKYSSSRDLQRLSRSPSPRRLSLASREQPVLELSLRSAENSRGQQCTEEALSTISGAKIVSISGGGSLSNSTRMVHREDSASLSTHQPELGRQSSFSGPCTDSQMCPRILNDHQELRDERNKLSSVPTQHEGSKERNMGNVARDGLECYGGDRELAPNN